MTGAKPSWMKTGAPRNGAPHPSEPPHKPQIRNELFPNYAIRFHKHVYAAREDVQCIIHTHPPSLSTLASIGEPLTIHHMDHTAIYNDTRIAAKWPGTPFGDTEGEFMVEHLGENGQVLLLPGHGALFVGRSIEEALYRAVFAEKAAEMKLRALQTGRALQELDHDLALQAHDWRLNGGGMKNHFHYWVRQLDQQ